MANHHSGDDNDNDGTDAENAHGHLVRERAPGGCVLLIVDMVSTWDFPDADALLQGARTIVAAVAALKSRCRAVGVPVIYANDNLGHWQSDFRQLVERSAAAGAAGADVTRAIVPDAADYFVLKPKHSGFYGSPLAVLLRHLRAERLIVTGVSSDQCVMATVNDARMRDWEVRIPRDCVASQTVERNRIALRQFEEVLKIDITPGSELELP